MLKKCWSILSFAFLFLFLSQGWEKVTFGTSSTPGTIPFAQNLINLHLYESICDEVKLELKYSSFH